MVARSVFKVGLCDSTGVATAPLAPAAIAGTRSLALPGRNRPPMTAQSAPKPKLKLYSADWCWYCRRVVDKLAELGLDYEYVEVPVFHSKRADVLALSGQTSVPVLVDGDVVLDDDDRIIPYLEKHYGRSA